MKEHKTKIYLYVDDREHKFIERTKELVDGILHLPVGDFMFSTLSPDEIKTYDLCNVSKEDKEYFYLLIERKTISDLHASLKGGRYREQKSRMKQFPCHQYMYLIEGMIQPIEINSPLFDDEFETKYSKNKKRDQRRIRSAIIGTMLRDNFNILQTTSLNDTIEWLRRLKYKLSSSSIPMMTQQQDDTETETENGNEKAENYLRQIKIGKKDNITPSCCFGIQLAQIPGISTITASHIIHQYPSWISLYERYRISKLDLVNHLSDIKIGQRRLGKCKAQRIIDYMFN